MKQKTNRAANKRFTISALGKVKRRPVHQAHFNGRDTGNETRRKHATKLVHGSNSSHIKELLPNK